MDKTSDTIKDFGDQWEDFTQNTGYYASMDALRSLINPLLDITDIRDQYVADVGAGTGRYTRMFHQAGVRKILALEPSAAFEVLKKNTADLSGIEYSDKTADEIPAHGFDWVFCIGVLQFIPDPREALISMGKALGEKGRLFLWVYSEEKNGLYLSLVRPLRRITARLPQKVVKHLAALLLPPAEIYALLSRRFPKLPLSEYLTNYFLRVNRYSRRLIIHDQLNPGYAKYYKQGELKSLLETCGYTDIIMHHRMGYSWSVVARYKT
ncbi:MAG: class I SAM-dependent methyltransferase [Desulfobulbaceae bacterium]|nr:class I SAM-dependent methyltransferase [Desulfobulbaceae bacterium]